MTNMTLLMIIAGGVLAFSGISVVVWSLWERRERVVLRPAKNKRGRYYWMARYERTGELAAMSDMPGFTTREACEADIRRLCTARVVMAEGDSDDDA